MNANINLTGMVNLAERSLGAEVLSATDDFFAEKENLLNLEDPVFIEGKFTERGKWMDGWESRRRRIPGHDSCVVRICRGVIHAINIETTHFTGNFPEKAMVEACDSDSNPDETTEWTEVLPVSSLKGDSTNLFEISSDGIWSHIRLNIYPDGGVARLRVYGNVHKNWAEVSEDQVIDLAATINGGVALACSDMHFGRMENLLNPGRAANMGDGWETARRRGPGHDWAVIQLGRPGHVQGLELDTLHFKGNYPATCAVQATYAPGATVRMLTDSKFNWQTLIDHVPMKADSNHIFDCSNNTIGLISHVMLEMHPDGGVGRLRVHGTATVEIPTQLKPRPLSADSFKPYGDVVELEGRPSRRINMGHADRFESLAELDLTEGGEPALSVFKARPISLPFHVTCMERHPSSSQLFIPKDDGRFLVLVAEGGGDFNPTKMELFISNGKQGINYHRGVWHHFLMAIEKEQEFVVIDRSNPDENTDEVELNAPYPIITSFE